MTWLTQKKRPVAIDPAFEVQAIRHRALKIPADPVDRQRRQTAARLWRRGRSGPGWRRARPRSGPGAGAGAAGRSRPTTPSIAAAPAPIVTTGEAKASGSAAMAGVAGSRSAGSTPASRRRRDGGTARRGRKLTQSLSRQRRSQRFHENLGTAAHVVHLALLPRQILGRRLAETPLPEPVGRAGGEHEECARRRSSAPGIPSA